MNRAYLLSDEDLQNFLKSGSELGKHMLSSFTAVASKENLPFNILEDNQIVNPPEIHVGKGDLWFCLEGDVEFVCGGRLLDQKFLQNGDGTENESEIQGTSITGGEEFSLKKGDWLWIPPGEPHQHSSKGLSRLLIVKI